MSDLKLYGVSLQVSDAAGYQTFGVMASSEKDAMNRFRRGESTGEMLDHEVEVIGLDSSFGIDDIEPYFDWKPDVRANSTIKQQAETIDKLVEALDGISNTSKLKVRGRDKLVVSGIASIGEPLHYESTLVAMHKAKELLATIKGE